MYKVTVKGNKCSVITQVHITLIQMLFLKDIII